MKLSGALIISAIFALSSCNTGNVLVNGDSPSGKEKNSAAGGVTNSIEKATTVYFERAQMEGAKPAYITAISFSSGSEETPSFGIPFSLKLPLSSEPLYSVLPDSVVILNSDGMGDDSLVANSKTVFQFPTEILQYRVGSSLDQVGWIDTDGNVFISSKKLETDEEAKDLRISGDQVLVRTSANAYLFNAKTGARKTKITGVMASSLSNSDLFYVLSSDRSLHQIDASGKDSVLGTLDSKETEIHDFDAIGDHRFLYWARLKNGSASLKIFDDGEKSLVALSIPSSTEDGIVCPTIAVSKIFFADLGAQNKYEIKQTTMGTHVSTFASPMDNSEGFICPQIGSGAR